MTITDSLETCPSCKIGTLVHTKGGAGKLIKYFSCGHTSRDVSVRVTGTEANFFTGRLGLEHRLGPYATEAISHTRGLNVDAFTVSMQQEMYKDAIHFIHEARRHYQILEHNPFTVWRNIRAAILFSFAAIECCINQFIGEHVKQNMAKMSPQEIDYWTEKGRRFPGIEKKLKEGVVLCGGVSIKDDEPLWSSFRDLKDLRDGLVHYKIENRVLYATSELLERTERGINTASEVIKKIYLAYPTNKTYPKVFDELP